MSKKQTLFQRNAVAIVMIPSIIGVHLAWSAAQKNRSLVAADEEIDLPVVTMAKYCWKRLTGDTGSSVKADAAPAAAAQPAAK